MPPQHNHLPRSVPIHLLIKLARRQCSEKQQARYEKSSNNLIPIYTWNGPMRNGRYIEWKQTNKLLKTVQWSIYAAEERKSDSLITCDSFTFTLANRRKYTEKNMIALHCVLWLTARIIPSALCRIQLTKTVQFRWKIKINSSSLSLSHTHSVAIVLHTIFEFGIYIFVQPIYFNFVQWISAWERERIAVTKRW